MTDSRPSLQYREVLDTAPDAMLVFAADGSIAYANAQTERLFGYSRAELTGQSLDLLIPERLRARHAHHVERYRASPVTRSMGSGLELFGRRKDGTEIPIEV